MRSYRCGTRNGTRTMAGSTTTETIMVETDTTRVNETSDGPRGDVVLTNLPEEDGSVSGPFSVWPRSPNETAPDTSPRRLFLATVVGACFAETSGQVVEHTMASETSKLRLEQRRREIRIALERVGFKAVEDKPRRFVTATELELQRAGTISGLALVGAVGSRAIVNGRSARRKKAGATKEEKDDSMEHLSTATSSTPRPSSTQQTKETYDVAKTVLFSVCYTGLWQPHWFNVLNSYDWTGLVTKIPLSNAVEHLGQSLFPLAVNQLVIIPLVYWPSYFLFTGAAERVSLPTSFQTLQRRLPELMTANLKFWIPVQAVQFSFVPVEDQAVYVAVMGVIWNGILASLASPGQKTRVGAATYGAAGTREWDTEDKA